MPVLLTVLLSFVDTLENLDRELFILIHAKMSGPGADWFFKLLRNALTWIPLYAFVLYWIIRYQKRNAWQFILLTLIVFAITDHTSAAIMKPYFARLRPCFDPVLEDHIRGVISCGGRYGMPSTHASNHFGMASFWFFSISWMSKKRWYWLWLWAFMIGYAQVYVGKHFPGDILAGALLGTLVGGLMALLFKKWRKV
jgi:membrane-associated phospholipid phosphatase